MKAKKSFRLKVAYYDSAGKRHVTTVTAPTEREARLKAAQMDKGSPDGKSPSMSLSEAVERYIDIKEPTISPTTVTAYRSVLRNNITGSRVGSTPVEKVSGADMQAWVGDLTRKGLSPKTVRNCASLAKLAVAMFTGTSIAVTYSQREKKELYCPSSDDLRQLLAWIRAKGLADMERAVLLAAFGPLRRGEICALRKSDINGNIVSVTKALVRTPDGEWVLKGPKTSGSYRRIEFPDFVIRKLMEADDKIVNYIPNSLTIAFYDIVKEAGLPHFRFHDLRHYSASIMAYSGISDKTAQARGGWSSFYTLRRVYQNEIDAETQKESRKINKYFKKVFGV